MDTNICGIVDSSTMSVGTDGKATNCYDYWTLRTPPVTATTCYGYIYFPTYEDKEKKAYGVAKKLMQSKLVSIKTVQQFMSLMDAILEAL